MIYWGECGRIEECGRREYGTKEGGIGLFGGDGREVMVEGGIWKKWGQWISKRW